MSLSDRLREWAQNEEMIDQHYLDHGKDCIEAADEIERLRAALAESCDENRQQVLHEGPFSTDTCPLVSKLDAKILRLRAALERIEELTDCNVELQDNRRHVAEELQKHKTENKALLEALMAVKGFCRHCGASYPHRCGEGRCRRCGVLANLDKMTSKCE